MLYSPGQRLAIACHPKTASTSLTAWMKKAFPDTVAANPVRPHVPVAEAIERLGLSRGKKGSRWRNVLLRRFAQRPALPGLVIAVIREPADMLASLYTYWRRRSSVVPRAPHSLAHTATHDSFGAFVQEAVVKERLPHYFEFLGVGGEAWHATRLIDFKSLEPGFRKVLRDYGVEPPAALPRANVATQTPEQDALRDAIRAEMPALMPVIQERYRWYYEEGQYAMVRGDVAAEARAAA